MKTIQQFFVILFLCSLVVGNSFGQSQQFVSLHGNQFKQNGEDFYPIVMNYGIRIYIDDENGNFFVGPYENYDLYNPPTSEQEGLDMILDDFKTIRNKMNFNCVRIVGLTFGKICIQAKEEVENPTCKHESNCPEYSSWPAFYYKWPFWDYYEQIEYPYTTYFNLIGKVLEVAEQAKLKVIFLAGGKKLDTQGVQDEFIGEGYVNDGYLEMLVKEFANNSTLFAYDFWNEPSLNDDQCYEKDVICKMVKRWSDIVHQNSNHHLTTIGLMGSKQVFEWDPGVMKLDFLSYHFYPPLRGLTTDPTSTQLSKAYNIVKSELYWIGNNSPIPWIVGETGFEASSNPDIKDDYGSIDDQGDYAELTLNQCRDCNGSGYSWWWYQDENFGNSQTYFGLIDDNENIKEPAVNEFINFNPIAVGSCEKPSIYYNYHNYDQACVSGTVKDQKDSAIEGAVVSLRAANWGGKIYYTYTDDEGSFCVYTDLTPDMKTTMRLDISAVGATKYENENVNLNSDMGDLYLCQFQPEKTATINNITIIEGERLFKETTTSIVTQNFTIEGNGTQGGICTLKAGERILLSQDFKAEKGCKFYAYNGSVYMDCDYLLVNCEKPRSKDLASITINSSDEIIISSKDDISIFPNPTDGIINVNLPYLNSSTSIHLTNMQGITVFNKIYSKEKCKIVINISMCAKGIYTMTIKNDEYSIAKKIILQ